MYRSDRNTTIAASGTLTKNADRQLMFSINQPPITGPMAGMFRSVVPAAAAEPDVVIAGAGHFLQEDAGEELADAIADFVARHPLESP